MLTRNMPTKNVRTEHMRLENMRIENTLNENIVNKTWLRLRSPRVAALSGLLLMLVTVTACAQPAGAPAGDPGPFQIGGVNPDPGGRNERGERRRMADGRTLVVEPAAHHQAQGVRVFGQGR